MHLLDWTAFLACPHPAQDGVFYLPSADTWLIRNTAELSVPSPSILWATKAVKKEVRAGEHEGGDASEACSKIVGDQNEVHTGQNPGDVLESVNCWRTCWSPLSHCVAPVESHPWQFPASENRTKVASPGYAVFASHHFQGCKPSNIKGMRHYLPFPVFLSSEGLLKKVD